MLSAGLAGLTTLVPAGAVADTRSFTGTASAVGADVSLTNPDVIPLGATVQVAGPLAQATLSGLGVSQGFAAAPYPGNEVAGAPGLLNGGFGIPAPSYPFLVSSDASSNPEPDDRSAVAGYVLHTSSSDTESEARGELGAGAGTGGVARAVAIARVTLSADGAVVAHAEATTSGVTVPDLLTVATARAAAVVSSDASGTLTRTSSFVVDGLRVLGVPVGVQDGSLVLAGQSVALPAAPLLDELASFGTTVEYLAPTTTQDSVVSAGLRITTRQVDPSGRTPGTYTIATTIGRASARLQSSSFADVPVVVPPPFVDPAVVPASDTGAGTSTGPVAGPVLPVTSVVVPGTAPVAGAPQLAPLPSASVVRLPEQVDWLPVFLALVLCSFAGLGAGTLVRLLGVRATWRS